MKTKLDLVIWIAEYAYRKANPNSNMEPPSIVYEQVEKDFLPILELYSDQQNKELREKHEKQIADWKREEKMWGEHELHYKAEIQRLTKEVEELRALDPMDIIHKKNLELTRLRELLGRSIDFIDRAKTLGVWDEAKQLLHLHR